MGDLVDMSSDELQGIITESARVYVIRGSRMHQHMFVFIIYGPNAGWMFGQQPNCVTTDVQSL